MEVINSIETNAQTVMRQTNYTEEEAVSKLQLYDNNVNTVIRLYLTNGVTIPVKPKPSLSINQQIYKEIRGLMDEIEVQKEKLK
jgi:hypothetical protein